MKTITGIKTGLLVLGLLFLCGIAAAQENPNETLLTDDVEPYNGPIGADSPLYGLKIALEDIDESFTANETERVNKEMNHARLRLSELRRALQENESESIKDALDNYLAKVNLTNVTVSRWSSGGTGLLHAQEMIIRHQFVLENLLASHPGNKGLQRAYENSHELENRFMERTAVQFQRALGQDNKTFLKTVRFGQKEQNRTRLSETGTNVTATEIDQKQKGWEKNEKPDITMGQQQGLRTQPPTTAIQARQTQQEQNRNMNQGSGTPAPVTTQQQEQEQQQDGGNNGKGNPRGR